MARGHDDLVRYLLGAREATIVQRFVEGLVPKMLELLRSLGKLVREDYEAMAKVGRGLGKEAMDAIKAGRLLASGEPLTAVPPAR